jgi:hypothetical protein
LVVTAPSYRRVPDGCGLVHPTIWRKYLCPVYRSVPNSSRFDERIVTASSFAHLCICSGNARSRLPSKKRFLAVPKRDKLVATNFARLVKVAFRSSNARSDTTLTTGKARSPNCEENPSAATTTPFSKEFARNEEVEQLRHGQNVVKSCLLSTTWLVQPNKTRRTTQVTG